MERMIGTMVFGIRTPIISKGDNLTNIVTDSVLQATKDNNIDIRNKDIIAITESIVARAQNNYITIDDIAEDVKNKFKSDTIGVIFPILSRNRFANCLKGIAKGTKKIILMLSYPADEVGNHLLSIDDLDEQNINPYTDVLTLEKYRKLFGYKKHTFTGIDYIEYYSEVIKECGTDVEIIFSNNAKTILNYTKNVLTCDIHTRARTKRILSQDPECKVLGLDDILNAPINNSGYNEQYGLLGCNKATEDKIKLFPRDCSIIVNDIQNQIYEKTGKKVEVMVYGDGAFKDPVGKIWELADPVVSPAYTSGLQGTPNELKLKYLADNEFSNLKGDDLKSAIKKSIQNKKSNLVGSMSSEGTTPRKLTDLIGSLCDLTSGSGDKGTPVVYVQGYFDNYTIEQN